MVVGLDLQPVTEETIAQMGYEQHDLWQVKIGSIIFGPFETESLKHYVGENEHLFENASATRMDNEEYKPFWEHATFQRRRLQSVNSDAPNEGPFWLLHNGLKVGPFSFAEIDKKIEVGVLGMTDYISCDDGHSWPKIYEIHQFDRRTLNPDELPMAPRMQKLELIDPLETPRTLVTEGLAELAHSAQVEARVIPFKVEEMTLQKPKDETAISAKLKWMIPTAVAGLFAVVIVGNFIMSNSSVLTATEEETHEPFYKLRPSKAPQHDNGSSVHRTPASITYTKRYHEPQNQDTSSSSSYPTHIETHDPTYEDMAATNPADGGAPMEIEQQQPEEHSLVSSGGEAPENQSLDAALNGAEQPVVEEVSDF